MSDLYIKAVKDRAKVMKDFRYICKLARENSRNYVQLIRMTGDEEIYLTALSELNEYRLSLGMVMDYVESDHVEGSFVPQKVQITKVMERQKTAIRRLSADLKKGLPVVDWNSDDSDDDNDDSDDDEQFTDEEEQTEDSDGENEKEELSASYMKAKIKKEKFAVVGSLYFSISTLDRMNQIIQSLSEDDHFLIDTFGL